MAKQHQERAAVDKNAGADTETSSASATDSQPSGGEAKGERQGGRNAVGSQDPQVVEIRPIAGRAGMRKRHWGLAIAFVVIVILPLAAIGWYLFERATDQYASVAGFSVRQEEAPGTANVLGGLTQFVGGSTSKEADMLYEYIRSQDLVAAIDARLDLRRHYSTPYDTDPIFALTPDSSIEELVDYWSRIVLVAYDQNTGLINLTVLAFAPGMAQELANEILDESQVLVNQLNATARSDSLRYAEEDLAVAQDRLRAAREALVRFRTRTQIVDPESDLSGRMGVLNSLQQQLAQALIDYDIVAQESGPEDPRVIQALRRIEVIRARIADERRNFTEDENAGTSENYPTLLAEYEGLVVDREFAEEAYRLALAALDMAKSNAARQSRYLSTYVHPTLPQTAEFPRRLVIFALAALFLLLLWSILSLMYYAVRDRK